jgi:hypothetical protein
VRKSRRTRRKGQRMRGSNGTWLTLVRPKNNFDRHAYFAPYEPKPVLSAFAYLIITLFSLYSP